MNTRARYIAILLLAAVSSEAQELVVVVESPGFTLDTRLSARSALSALAVTAESPSFTLDTGISSGPALPTLLVTAESPTFTLDTRLTEGNPSLAALVVTAESAAFVLDTRLAGRPEYLIVQAVSPAFELNTMWLGIRKTARALGSPVDLYWPTNAPGFRLQSASPSLGPSAQWMDVATPPSESGGLNHVPLDPADSHRYFRLKL